MRQRAEYEQRMFEALGIKIKINENTFARVLERMEQGNFQFGSGTGWALDYPDPENFFMLFYSKNFPREGANYCRYSRPEFDNAYEQMATMDNGPERLAIIQKMNAMLAEDCPAIWEFDKAFYVATQPWARWTHNSPMIEERFQQISAGRSRCSARSCAAIGTDKPAVAAGRARRAARRRGRSTPCAGTVATMFSYLVRRLLYAVPILLGVIFITFLLDNVMMSPEAKASRVLGPKAARHGADANGFTTAASTSRCPSNSCATWAIW